MSHRLLFIGLLLSLSASAVAQETSREITLEDIRTHVSYLASDELDGRGSGTPGNARAAEYIAAEFKRFGLSPGGTNGTFLQPFEFVSAVEPGSDNKVTFMS